LSKKHPSFLTRVKRKFVSYLVFTALVYGAYYALWGQHVYKITAYCNCPICINVPEYRDNKFASGKKLYWGAVAADPKVKFNSKVELIPTWPQDWLAALYLLKGRRNFTVEDRGGLIKGKDIDIYIPDSMGGHQTARNWGVRRMRIKINGEWAE
jgi:3D (Asp-Asp-Asp) domain-containing protein